MLAQTHFAAQVRTKDPESIRKHENVDKRGFDEIQFIHR